MLGRLKRLYDQKSWLSGRIIDEADDLPSSAAYRNRFGSQEATAEIQRLGGIVLAIPQPTC